MPRKPIRPIEREPKIGPRPPSHPMLEPQWGIRAFERAIVEDEGEEVDELEWENECRLCACTDSSPCAEGCGWAEGDLCTACAEKRDWWQVLWLCDGYGIAASWAFAGEPTNESNALA